MLKQLRNKKTAKKIWIALAVLIIPAFVLWGSGSLLRNKEESGIAGRIFGRRVSLLEYKDAYEAVKNMAIMQFGDNFSEIRKYLNLENQAWERLILLYEAKRRRLNASDREIIELIESYPIFGRRGQFDNRVYAEMLRYALRTQPRIFEEQVRQNIMLSKLYRQVTEDVSVNDKEIREEYRRLNEEVSIYYIASVSADFVKDLNSSEEELRNYFAKNPLAFKQPLSFNLEYASADTEEKIKQAALFLQKNRNLDKAAAQAGLSLKETGFFAQTDPIPGIGWSPEIVILISKLKKGEVSGPLHLDKNYYILRLKDRKEAYVPDFNNIKEKVREVMVKDASAKKARARIQDCYKGLKELSAQDPKAVDFNKAAREYGLKAGATGFFKYGSYIEGIGASDIFWLKAQELKENESSGVIEVPSGFYIVRLKAKNVMDEKRFESEKAEFGRKLLEQKKQEYFNRFFEDLKHKA